MVGVDLIGNIRRAYFEQRRPIKEIVRTLSVSRATVRRVVRSQKTVFTYERTVQPAPKLGEWVVVLTGILEREAKLPRRERRSTQRLFEELRGRGYDGAHDSVHRFTRVWREERARVPQQAYVPLSFAPGEAYQFDWSHETITLNGQELVFDAHDKAFQFYGGVCRRGIYDNMKTAVEAIFVGKARQYNRRFLQMCSHHLVEPVACTPAAGWEKGQVENQVGTLRDQLFRPKPRVSSLAELNAWLEDQCIAYAKRHPHPEFKERTIWDVFQDEQASLMELRGPFDGFVEKAVRASTTCLIMADHNRYSVDARAAGRMVLVRSHAERIVVLFDDGGGRACPAVPPQPDRLRPLALPAGADEETRRAAQWRSVQGLEPARRLGPGARQAAASCRRRPTVRQGARRGARPWGGRGRGRLRRGARRRDRQWRRDPGRAGAARAARAAALDHHAGGATPEDRARGRLWPL